MKTAKSKKSKNTNPLKPTTNKTFGLLIGLLVVSAFVQGCFIYYLWNLSNLSSSWHVRELIISAQNDLYDLGKSQVTKDSLSGDFRIPNAKLKIPANEKYAELSAIYTPESTFRNDENNTTEYVPAEINLTNNIAKSVGRGPLFRNQDNIEKMFASVPLSQSCLRQVLIKVGPLVASDKTVSDYTFAYTKKLSDGREIYVFTSNICSDGANDFANYIKSVDSY